MKFAKIALALAVLASPAAAQDWSGFYAGVQAGKGMSNDSGVFALPSGNAALDTAFAPGFSGSFNDNEIGGLHAGYDWQSGNMVYGVVGDLNFGSLGDVQQGRSVTPALYSIERNLDGYATLRGRVGYLATPKVLVYGTAGLAYGDVEFGYQQPGSRATTTTSGGQDRKIGTVIGAGIETKVSEKMSIGLEYLHVNMGGNDFTANLVGGPFSAVNASTNATGSDNDFNFGTVQIKATYRF